MLEQCGLEVRVPSEILLTVGGAFAEQCALAPITRTPIGPSCLGYGVCTQGLVGEGKIFWKGVPADHAGVVFACKQRIVERKPPQRAWQCQDFVEFLEWRQRNGTHEHEDIDSLHKLLLAAQHERADSWTCAQRHREWQCNSATCMLDSPGAPRRVRDSSFKSSLGSCGNAG